MVHGGARAFVEAGTIAPPDSTWRAGPAWAHEERRSLRATGYLSASCCAALCGPRHAGEQRGMPLSRLALPCGRRLLTHSLSGRWPRIRRVENPRPLLSRARTGWIAVDLFCRERARDSEAEERTAPRADQECQTALDGKPDIQMRHRPRRYWPDGPGAWPLRPRSLVVAQETSSEGQELRAAVQWLCHDAPQADQAGLWIAGRRSDDRDHLRAAEHPFREYRRPGSQPQLRCGGTDGVHAY